MALSLVDALLPEFDHELTLTRRLLERAPEDRFDWKPHEKSMSLGGLATHLANLPTWAEIALKQSEFDLAASPPAPLASSRRELLERIDRNTANARAALAGRTDGELMAPWTLKSGSHTIFTMPKTSVLRSFCLNHIVHHRGQLSVYLRLLNVPVPSIYGPSADEGQT
jgi:uncharacterized damage-inducible protein DinB